MKQPYSAASSSALTVLHELLAAPPRESEDQIYVNNINPTGETHLSEAHGTKPSHELSPLEAYEGGL